MMGHDRRVDLGRRFAFSFRPPINREPYLLSSVRSIVISSHPLTCRQHQDFLLSSFHHRSIANASLLPSFLHGVMVSL
jgi:hypothetical protein